MTEIVGGAPLFARVRRDAVWQPIVAGTAVVVSLISFGELFPTAALGAFRVWVASPTFNHCFLVLPITMFLIWQRRRALVGVPLVSDMRAPFVMIALAFVWFVVTVAGVLEAEQFVILSMVQVMLFGILGPAFYRALAAPFLYLYFLVPSGAFLIPVLQAFTARFAVVGLHLLGIPVFSNGAVIEIPAGTFVVAEACAGLRFLIAAVAFGVFYAVFTYRSPVRRAVFIALSIVVPIIANGFRALGLIAAAQWIGNPESALADHILYGWMFFSLVLLILIFVGNLFSDRKEDAHPAPLTPRPAVTSLAFVRCAAIAVACLAVAASGDVAASYLNAPRSIVMPDHAPLVSLPWHEVRHSGEWRPKRMSAASTFAQSFESGADRVDRYIALYPNRGRGGNLIRSDDRDASERLWNFDSQRSARLTVRGHDLPVSLTTWINGDRRRIVWSFYVVNGFEVSTPWAVKWRQFRAYLTADNCASAYVALSTEISDEAAATIAAERLLAATLPLASYLCGTTNSTARR